MFRITQRILFILSICLTLQACGGGGESKNSQPTVSIQAPLAVDELSSVNLIASASDSDGAITSYQWQQLSGLPVALIGENAAQATFVAPEVTVDESLQFSVLVTDDQGAQINENVTLVVQNINKLPLISISSAETVNELAQVILTADISDADGTIVDTHWQQISGTPVSIEDTTQRVLTLMLPDINADEAMVFSFTVTDNDGGVSSETITLFVRALTLAQTSNITEQDIVENDLQPSIFITALDLNINEEVLERVGFTIKARAGALAAPIKASYAIDTLAKLTSGIKLPIYGLYRSHVNDVELAFTFIDGSVKTVTTQIATEANIEPIDNPFNDYQISEPVTSANTPSYDYLLMKSSTNGPVIMDIDGNVRWQSYLTDGELYNGRSTVFKDGRFIIAEEHQLYTVHLDGTFTSAEISHSELSDIEVHHELSIGKTGYLVEIDTNKTGYSERLIESILVEVDDSGDVIKQWDFAEIIEKYMLENGDDPSNFVRNGVDWFHMNSAIYQEDDNSLLVSSRENFVIKIDYDSEEIIWLFGDESKHWYINFPSLRMLSLTSSDTKPIGQHALSMVDGELLLFNDGQLSFNQPEDAPKGLALTTSPSARYAIDEDAMMASITWSYDADIYSDVCSSIYQDERTTNGDYLVNFAAVNRLNAEPIFTIIQGVNEAKSLLFEFKFETKKPCFAAWNSTIVYGLEALVFN